MFVRRIAPYNKKPSFSFMPDFIVEKVSDINFELLASYGIKNCFIDLDDTVVERGQYAISPGTIDAIRKSELRFFIATNRPRSKDLKNLKEDLLAEGVAHPSGVYAKPAKKYFTHALEEFGLLSRETVMIGDRYFQDALGANRAGLYSLVVHKLGTSVSFLDAVVSRIEKTATHSYTRRYSK